MLVLLVSYIPSFFFNDTATSEIYTLSLHDALPISRNPTARVPRPCRPHLPRPLPIADSWQKHTPLSVPRLIPDRKSTRLNSSHPSISYAVFCLKKKKLLQNISLNSISHQPPPQSTP